MVASLQFRTGFHVRTVLTGVVGYSECWAEEMLQGLARFLACLTQKPNLRGLVVDDVGKSSDMLANSVFDGVAMALPRLDFQVVIDVLRMASTPYFQSVQPCTIVNWLVVCLRSARRMSIMKRLPILSRVSPTFFIWNVTFTGVVCGDTLVDGKGYYFECVIMFSIVFPIFECMSKRSVSFTGQCGMLQDVSNHWDDLDMYLSDSRVRNEQDAKYDQKSRKWASQRTARGTRGLQSPPKLLENISVLDIVSIRDKKAGSPKKLSHEFSRSESRILGALFKRGESLLNSQIRTQSGTGPGTFQNTRNQTRIVSRMVLVLK